MLRLKLFFFFWRNKHTYKGEENGLKLSAPKLRKINWTHEAKLDFDLKF